MCWRHLSLYPALRLTWGALCRVISAARDLLSNRRSSICRVSQPRPVHLSNPSVATCFTAQSAYVCCFSFQSHAFWWVMTSRTACRPTSKKVRNEQCVFVKMECIIAQLNLRTSSAHSVRSSACSFLSQQMLLFIFSCSVCPKWAKIQKQHTQMRSVLLLIVCSSALRTIELIKSVLFFVFFSPSSRQLCVSGLC